jgi:hypothetical protein
VRDRVFRIADGVGDAQLLKRVVEEVHGERR